jgi:acyl-coenzyme A thioesterase PaaI-like protein
MERRSAGVASSHPRWQFRSATALTELSLQEQIPHNHCFGCGPKNEYGLGLRSYWTGVGPSVARFTPQPYHCAGPAHVVNGGVIATLIDCHCVCTAIAAGYLRENRAIGSLPLLAYATSELAVRYRRPAYIGETIELAARIMQETPRGLLLACTLDSDGRRSATATVEAARVRGEWLQQGIAVDRAANKED